MSQSRSRDRHGGHSRDRTRDRGRERGTERRGGYRRPWDLTEDEGSPVVETRERHRHARDEDEEAEARRQRRRERRRRERELDRERERDAMQPTVNSIKHQSMESADSRANLLSADELARLVNEPEHEDWEEEQRARDQARRERRKRKKAALAGVDTAVLGAELMEGGSRHKSGARVVSGAYLEEGRSADTKVRRRGGGGAAMEEHWKDETSWTGSSVDGTRPFWKFWANWSRKKRIVVGAILAVLLSIAIIVPVVLLTSHKKNNSSSSESSIVSTSSSPSNNNLDSISRASIPSYAAGTVIDPYTWYDTEGFNVTFTNATIGGLYIMGLNSSWDDSARANSNVPPLNESFPYGSQPIRGVNIGGWLSIEPWIMPSLFDVYSSDEGIIDEWTLSEKLGDKLNTTIEKHYSEFYSESDFAEIRDAGLDHVRLQYSYWAVTTYDGDPYLPKVSWRYLLRAIEWCRKYGLRVNLDLHGLPGSQNGWNHSGRLGKIAWLNGTDGDLNRNRSLAIHDQLSTFFSQDRYKNIVTMYGLANEPLMLSLPTEKVLNWTHDATELVRSNGLNSTVIFHDGFLNLDKWDTMFKDHPDNMYLDTHQYTTFNTGEIVLNHTRKIELICSSWYTMIEAINSTTNGWGPTICGEWSQADTDCGKYLNNVGRGTRWEGTYDTSSTTQYCPTADAKTCSCDDVTADVSTYSSTYKKWLLTYAEAQMSVFETAMGWFYWTWRTESAAQWSYRTAWKNGFMPSKAYTRTFKCGDTVPDFSGLSEVY
ncbi:Glycoside hydrolase superfamily [Penicillium taxi]|uniref:Glycoside hydrolase superfamily n=1 Tax=Penicillium taxi TaxID=168475 RepID=UPI0025457A40|nr:Glycoside hydrolase superfamily [Penicillium taxi]KAJ5899359.1 Glycoside hydrolase superfamily [Penicillium taxi]